MQNEDKKLETNGAVSGLVDKLVISDVTKLVEQREAIRKQEKKLTEQIKDARKEEARRKKQEQNANQDPKVTFESYAKLANENKRLRSVIAMMTKFSGNTYAKAGEAIGVSSTRARRLIKDEIRHLRRKDRDDENL